MSTMSKKHTFAAPAALGLAVTAGGGVAPRRAAVRPNHRATITDPLPRIRGAVRGDPSAAAPDTGCSSLAGGQCDECSARSASAARMTARRSLPNPQLSLRSRSPRYEGRVTRHLVHAATKLTAEQLARPADQPRTLPVRGWHGKRTHPVRDVPGAPPGFPGAKISRKLKPGPEPGGRWLLAACSVVGPARRPRPARNTGERAPRPPAAAVRPIPPCPSLSTPARDIGESSRNGDIHWCSSVLPRGRDGDVALTLTAVPRRTSVSTPATPCGDPGGRATVRPCSP